MSETRSILDAWDRERAAGRSAILATVVRVSGSAYRGPGARMLLCRDGVGVGLVSGGCLEVDLAERAREVDESKPCHTVVYDLRSPDDVIWGLGLGCSGEIRVLLERLDAGADAAHLEFLRASLDQRTSGVMAVAFSVSGTDQARVGDRWYLDADGALLDARADEDATTGIVGEARRALRERRSRVVTVACGAGSLEVLVEHIEPPIALFVFGAGADAAPLVHLAAGLGWDVTVADPRPAYARPERFPDARRVVLFDPDRIGPDRIGSAVPRIDDRSASVVLTHNFLHDRRILEFLVDRGAPYIGLLGPLRRAQKLIEAVEGARLGGPIHGPVGLDIGADTPSEIALSILAEIQARFAGRHGGFLRDRGEALHPSRHTR